MEKFSELQYVRPDLAETQRLIKEAAEALKNAQSYEEAKAALLKKQEVMSEVETLGTIANIRHDVNTADAFYDAEVKFINDANAKLSVLLKEFSEALAGSSFRSEFEKEYGDQLFRILDADIKTTGEEIVDCLIEEGDLRTAYAKTAASCKTTFRGEECNFYGLLKHMLSTDREERKEALQAWAALYESVSDKLDDIYAKLCANRRVQAQRLGFDNYIDMVYLSRYRFDYKPEDIERFRNAIAKYVTPVAAKIHEARAKRLGVEKLEYYDEELFFPEGNSTPDKDTAGMIKAAQQMYRELSPETAEFFDFMVSYDLFDLETKPNKHLGGYCTGLPKYKAPFIFSNFNKTSADTEVLTHEAGHAFEAYTASRTQELMEYMFSTSEVNEIHSMGMEFFTDPWYDLFYPQGEGKRYRYEHLADSFANLTYLVSVDEFQHRVFEGEQPDAKELRRIWRKIENTYMPWRSYDGIEFLEEGGFWMQKQHIFLYPFYYVDYALAMLCALQLYLRMRTNREEAWNDYLKLCKLGGSLGYFELLQAANLKNPFEEETVKEVCAGVLEALDELEKAL